MSGRLIEEDLFTKYSIIDSRTAEGQGIHDFLAARARALAKKYVDFNKTPVTFVLSDSDKPNAFYAPAPDPDPDKRPRRSDYETIRFIKNPLDTPIICVTRGLIEMVDNLDQLDFVLGHELTHMIMRQHGIEHNSKGEEEIADLHAVDLMYDAGGDPKQALLMSDKISAHSKEERKKEARRRYRSDREKEEGINWAEIFDVHMTDGNRKAGIEASLTRLSHLIDDKQPTGINKSSFEPRYNDPVDTFLQANNYEGKKPLGKLRVLIDCIDHLSDQIPAEEFFKAELDALPEETDRFDWRTADRRKALQERIDAGYTDYFDGSVIDKRYQQKLANLAEGVIKQAEEERQRKGNSLKPAVVNGEDLNIYLQDRAYKHIATNGYPVAGDLNYLSASGILYSYFYCLLENHSPRRDRDEENEVEARTQIEIDIRDAKEKIRTADTAESFIEAADELDKLNNIFREIRTINYGREGRGEKLDNLTGLSDYRIRSFRDKDNVYGELKSGEGIPWNNLVEIAKTDAQTKERVVQFLKQNNIEDFRITHALPYIRAGYRNCYSVTENGQTSAKKIPDYELDFAIHQDTVLQAYDYVRKYFDSEAAVIDATCAAAIDFDDEDFKEFEKTTDTFNRHSIASKKAYDFVSLFNALPDEEEDKRYGDARTAISLIPEHHQKAHPMPGSKEVNSGWRETTVFEFSKDLLSFENPIFQEHFGADFERELVARKEAQQRQMFDTAFTLLERTIDTWLDAKPKFDDLSERSRNLSREIWDSEDEEFIKTKRAEQETLEKELNFYKEKEDTTHSLAYNLLTSIFKNDRTRWQLQRLTPEQKAAFAEFAARDEKGAIIKLFDAEGYENFCDFLGILEEQTERVITGKYGLTDMMQIVVNNYGYQPAHTQEALKAFVDENKGKKYSRDNKKYAWYLHVFDSMQYLEKTPKIDVGSLATALTEIEQEERSSRGSDSHEIVSARNQNYRKFLKQSNVVALAARAIDYQDNYKDLSCNELLETADALIAMRNQVAKVFDGKSDYDYSGRKQKSQTTPEQQRFLNLVDKNIRGVIRRAEHQALQNDDPSEKITNLYLTYNAYRQYSDSSERSSYLAEIDKKEGRLKHISSMSEDKAFWPDDVLNHVKAFVFARNTFLDDKEFEDRLLNDILEKLEAQPAGKKKNECLFILLDKNLRAAYPETRDRLFAIYTDDVEGKLGKDDGSEVYQKRLAIYLNALASDTEKDWDIGKRHGQRDGMLSNSMSSADKYLLMRRLSDAIISQEQTSKMIKESCQVKLNSNDMVRSYLYGIGVDYLTEEMDRDAEMANRFIEFFNSNGEQKDCEDISAYIEVTMKDKYSQHKDRLDAILKNTTPSNCKILYENFWSAPLEARAVIIARMLKSAVNNNETQENEQQHSWEKVFDLVMDTLISPEDDSVEAKYARDIMHSYIKSRSDYERELIMSAMMVANRNIGNDKGNIGKALKLFLENMGPAEIKLGQAIASHPDTPENIRIELQKLKSSADMPARWTIYEWIRTENIPEELWKDQYLGEILGSASYYTTTALGEDKVLRILRPEAREKATKGFKVIRSTVDDLKGKEATSDLSYRELTSSVQEMVIQAARMSEIETDHEVGQQQYQYAKEIYDGVTIASGGQEFPLKVMDWKAKGQNWIIMDRANGPTFNAMPDNTPEQLEYKRAFAKAYIVFEITNILSGKKFDHDKHGAQLSIDESTNAVGIYDTGAMALHDPSSEEQKVLGNIVYDVIKATLSGNETFTSFSRVIGERIDALHQDGIDTQYLVEVKKGLLALGDFFKVLTQEDIKDILPSINLSTDVSEAVQHGITENMSMFEKAQYKAFLAMHSSRRNSSVTVARTESASNLAVNVENVTALPDTRSKASWLQDAFSNPEDDSERPEVSSFTPAARLNSYGVLRVEVA